MSEDRVATWRPFVERMRGKGWSDQKITERLAGFGLSNADVTRLVRPGRAPTPEPVAERESASAPAPTSTNGQSERSPAGLAPTVALLIAVGLGVILLAHSLRIGPVPGFLFIVLHFPILFYCFGREDTGRLLGYGIALGFLVGATGGLVGFLMVMGSGEPTFILVPILFAAVGWIIGFHLGVLIGARQSRATRVRAPATRRPAAPARASVEVTPRRAAPARTNLPPPPPAVADADGDGVGDRRIETGKKYVTLAREHGKAEPAIVEALRHAGWDQVQLAALSQALDVPLGKGTQFVRHQPLFLPSHAKDPGGSLSRAVDVVGALFSPPREEGPGWSFRKVMRLVGALLPLAFAGYNAGACLFYLLIRRPMPVWGGEDGFMVGIPGVPFPTDTIRPGSGPWWFILLTYTAIFCWIGIGMVGRMGALSTATSRKRPAGARPVVPPQTPPPPPHPPEPAHARPTTTKRIALIDPAMTRKVGLGLVIGSTAVLFLIVSLVLSGSTGEAAAEAWGSVIYYLLAAVLSPLLIWASFRFAASTEVVLSVGDLRLERWRKTVWRVPWADFTGWWAELGGTGNLKSIAIRCRDGTCRRIGMTWLGLPPSHYRALFSQIERYSGMAEAPPAQVERDITNLSSGVLIIILVIAVIATIAVLMQKP